MGQIVLLAPTGSAAANIGGSTYHSYLGINDHNKNLSQMTMSKLRQKLDKVRYIFIDEVSMLSCVDMYRISAQLAILMNEFEEPFGGLNVIFAGDFAQLPPAGKTTSLYGRVGDSNSMIGQKNTIGKALWHQTTTVVILRENMRQRSQTPDDAKFRNALENMRYKNCTMEDIEYLHGLASQSSVKQRLEDDRFRNVSVITALNIHRDRINELGSNRFAVDNGCKLISFYSKDSWPGGARSESAKKLRISKTSAQTHRKITEKYLSPSLQKAVWDLPPKLTDHRLGRLKLCKGLPVLIKYNEATECCVTNGAEAKVIDWITYKDPHTEKQILKTLFVELQNPPTAIQIEGLPRNVVPLSSDTKTIKCELPDGSQISISRTQVPVIPNFAMTDYCSQGRTRPFNVVHLNHCPTHQSYYTCLSRSATHTGTLILNGINSQAITSTKTNGLSGNIRQEFRELELLDEISKLRYEDKLPDEIQGHVRRDLITSYRNWKGEYHVPANVHNALKWNAESPFVLAPCENVKWKIVNKLKEKKNAQKTPIGYKSMNEFIPAHTAMTKGTDFNQTARSNNKSTYNVAMGQNINAQRVVPQGLPPSQPLATSTRTGMIWDSRDYSCAYDSLFTILWNMWQENYQLLQTQDVHMENLFFHTLLEGFDRHGRGQMSLEEVRNSVRNLLRVQNIHQFPIGHGGVEIKDLLNAMSLYHSQSGLGQETTLCNNCGMHQPSSLTIRSNNFVFTQSAWKDSYPTQSVLTASTEQMALLYLKGMQIATPCSVCTVKLFIAKKFDILPRMFVLHVGQQRMQISHKVDVDMNQQQYTYKLRGLIYFGDFHFTSQFVSGNEGVWYHDGIETNRRCQFQGSLANMENNALLYSRGRQLCSVIYALE